MFPDTWQNLYASVDKDWARKVARLAGKGFAKQAEITRPAIVKVSDWLQTKVIDKILAGLGSPLNPFSVENSRFVAVPHGEYWLV